MPSNHLILSSPSPAFNLSQHQGLFQWVSSLHQMAKSIRVSASVSVLPMNIQGWFPLGLAWSPCCPRDSQESSPTPQFKSINSSAFSFLFGPGLTSVHDYWKDHRFDWMYLCHQRCSCLLMQRLGLSVTAFLPMSKLLLISWLQSLSTVILEPNKIKSASFHFFLIYLLWSDGTRCHDLSSLKMT